MHDALIRQACLQPDVAGAIAFGVAERLRRTIGGAQFYIGKGLGYDLGPRDREIWERHKAGASVRDLALRFRLSEVRIRKILRIQRRLALKRKGLAG